MMQGQLNDKNKLALRLVILSIALLAGVAIFILKMTGDASELKSDNIELTSSLTSVKKDKSTINAIPNSQVPNLKITQQASAPESSQQTVIPSPVWKLNENLNLHIEQLFTAAIKGDDKATYILAMNLRYCSVVPVDDIGLEKRLQQASEFSDSDPATT